MPRTRRFKTARRLQGDLNNFGQKSGDQSSWSGAEARSAARRTPSDSTAAQHDAPHTSHVRQK